MINNRKQRFNNITSNGKAKRRSFVMIMNAMFDSDSWRYMSPTGRALYMEIRRKYNGYNNGEIGFSCRQAGEVLGCTKNTASKAFLELIIHGFIKPAKTASFSMRHSREWTLTCEAVAKHAPTNEWKNWQDIKFDDEYLARAQEKYLQKIELRKAKNVSKNDLPVPQNDTNNNFKEPTISQHVLKKGTDRAINSDSCPSN
jgi:hypothetical protein